MANGTAGAREAALYVLARCRRFDAWSQQTIQTAAGPMKKHAITACHTDQGQALYSKEELSEIFLAENRITVSESLL